MIMSAESDAHSEEEPVEAAVSEPMPDDSRAENEPDVPAPEPERLEVEEEVASEPAAKGNMLSFTQNDDEDEVAEQVPPRVPKTQRRQSNRSSRKNQPALRSVTARFAACGRCSYFWAGYRVLFGLEELETAVSNSKSGWMELIWNEQMPELVHKSYGVRLDITHFHYEGCCKECRRHFIYQAAEDEADADAFRIEISPRMSK